MTMLTRRNLLESLLAAPLAMFARFMPAKESGYLATPQNTPRCNVYDANGTEWKNVRWVHTGTGEIEVYSLDIMGRKYLNSDNSLAVSRFVIPSPVRLEPIADDLGRPLNLKARPLTARTRVGWLE